MNSSPEICLPVNKGKEARIIAKTLKNFNFKKCKAWFSLSSQFSSGIRFPELLSIAYVLQRIVELPDITRSEKRSFPCLVKWFDDNWEAIKDPIKQITLLDENTIPINGQRENLEKTRIFEKVTPTIKVILLLDLFTNYKIISLTEYIFNINKKLFLYKKFQSIDKYYKTFIPKRLSNRWDPAYNIILCHKAYKF